MSHKKANSTIHVPFSWEKMPGVPKFMASPMCALVPGLAGNNREVQNNMVLPLPPGSFRQLPGRSDSKRMVLMREEDPFRAAIIECTKDCDHDCKAKEEIKMRFGRRVRISKCFLSSCIQSFDIQEGSLLMKPSSLGCIVRRDRV
ncbi:uncharacterized protein LOC112513017 [Cynara cardunculus var. scolymus]|uniref:uncharacterized protein LOC112513017 n=1 Tax=Cynara cardunculus var. scolymus TaxID=59895 RepID=UPI000D624BDE|nr:uncharacterized protein LOC112513017 [Cynara cardunculus var. scolymus]